MIFRRIENLRTDNDYTQQEIADIIGKTKKTYWKYEKGYSDIPISAAIKLADFYGVRLDYLLGISNRK